MLSGDDDRRRWRAEGPLLDGWGVYHAMADSRDGTVYAAANHVVYGPTVQRSTDRGKTWTRSRKVGLPQESGRTLNATWHIEPGPPEEPETLYLGGDPGVLFRSRDGGERGDRVRARGIPGRVAAQGIGTHGRRERVEWDWYRIPDSNR